MKGYSKWFLVALLGLAAFLLTGTVTSPAFDEQQPKAAAAQAQDELCRQAEPEIAAVMWVEIRLVQCPVLE